MRDAHPLYAITAVRAIDAAAIAGGIPGYALMGRAGAAAFEALQRRWPSARRLLVLCGPGNNGGDGYVLARLARASGYAVELRALTDAPPRNDEARQAFDDWRAAGGATTPYVEGESLPAAELIVDALFGIGLDRPPQPPASTLIEAVNASGVPVFALDAPSGIDAERGSAPGAAIRAAATLSFIAAKRGLYTGAARAHCGALELALLDVPALAFADQPVAAWRVDANALSWLPRRRAEAHKGDHGHVLAVGGDLGGGGALRMCVEAALRTGAGLVSAVTRAQHVAAILAARPECMVHASERGELPEAPARRASVIALGPGLGQGDWGRALFMALYDDSRPQVLDADALNLLAAAPHPVPGRVLTPHPGEAARLLEGSAAQVQADRFEALDALVQRYQAAVVLKGAGTLVGAPVQTPVLIDAGNPGMASGGMGDVLTGVIAALLAQGLPAFTAAWLGAMLHAVAGDRAACSGGMRGLLASDLMPFLRGEFEAT